MMDLAIIPARGGSVGLPGKNIRPLGDVPLIGWTIAAARASELFKTIVVSTDSQKIADIATERGAQVWGLRPAELSGSAATSNAVIEHVLSQAGEVSSCALLQPTSPFRTARHIREAYTGMCEAGGQSMFGMGSAKPATWLFSKRDDGSLEQLSTGDEQVTRRQDAREYYLPNGSLYLFQTERFRSDGGLVLDGARGYFMGTIDSLDIDTLEDFQIAEGLVAMGVRKIDRT